MGVVIKDSRCIVTGGAQGIGFQFCRHLLVNGAQAVAILDIDVSNGTESIKKLNTEFGKGRTIVFLQTDVTNLQQLEENFKNAVKQLGGLDIMINNAGVIDDAKWQMEVDLNVKGLIQGTLLAINTMGKHKGGKGGTIINLGSIAAFLHEKYIPVYCATKAAVVEFSRCVALSYDKTGVAIKTICPGPTETYLMTNENPRYCNYLNTNECRKFLLDYPRQPIEDLVKEVIRMIEEAPNGAIWVKMVDIPLSSVNIPTLEDMLVST